MTTITYAVRSLDVWGHSPSECHEYGCPCMVPCHCGDPTHEGATEHDENRCQCGYDVNDSFAAGSIELAEDASDADTIAALVDAGFLNDKANTETVTIDDPSCMGEDLTIEDAEKGMPLYWLTKGSSEEGV